MKKLITNSGCTGCHSLDGSDGVGPTWKGLFGTDRKLSDGSSVLVNEEYLIDSIKNPNAEIVDSYPANVMPQAYADQFSEDEINNIVAFIEVVELGNRRTYEEIIFIRYYREDSVSNIRFHFRSWLTWNYSGVIRIGLENRASYCSWVDYLEQYSL